MISCTAYNSTVYTSIQATIRGTDNTMTKRKRTKGKNNDLQNTHTTNDRVIRTEHKNGRELMCSGRVSSSCSTSGIQSNAY